MSPALLVILDRLALPLCKAELIRLVLPVPQEAPAVQWGILVTLDIQGSPV